MQVSPWPMVATLARIFIVPLIVVLMMWQPADWPLWCAVLFIVASITDWLDGYLARRLNSVSVMGKFLDPIADKVLVSSILIMLIPLEAIEALAVIILINRDVIIGGIRSVAATKGQVIDAGQMGKWKTALQMVAIPSLLLSFSWDFLPFQELGYWGLWLSVILSLYSGVGYWWRWRKMNQSESETA